MRKNRRFNVVRYNLFLAWETITSWLTAPFSWLNNTSWLKLYRLYKEQKNSYFAALDRINKLEKDVALYQKKSEHLLNDFVRMCENVDVCRAEILRWQAKFYEVTNK